MEIWIPVISAIITGALTLIGVVATNRAESKAQMNKIENELRMAQAVTDTKIEELTREVREHNGFARRLPEIETKVKNLEREVFK